MGAIVSIGRLCPACGRPTETRCRPFCSRRCADLDFWRWLGGVYSVPTNDRPAGVDQSFEGDDG